MVFERAEDALAWYEGQERVLTPEFLKTIPWQDVSKHPLSERFVPVLLYMRDVENFTSIYFDYLRRTPTGRDPVIRRFMDRWSTEETVHGDLINRFLNEAGFPTSERWEAEARSKIPLAYRFHSRLQPHITNLIGKHFSAVHMTWGAINELSTLSGYERLWKTAEHPVLEHILRAIAREEARHSLFYWSIARIKLFESPFRQKLARFMVRKFWEPVGQGTKRAADVNVVIATLFKGMEGLDLFDKRVTARIQQLPGFEDFRRMTERVAEIAVA